MTIQLNSATGTITVDAGALNFTGLAASTWQLTAGALTISAAGGVSITSGLTCSGSSPLLVTAAGAHRFSGGDLSIDVACDFGSAGAVTAAGNPTFNFGTGLSTFGGSVAITTNCDVGGTLTHEIPIVPKDSSHTVLASESGSLFTNEGATARQDFTLPTAAAGLHYRFYVQDADDIRVIAGAGDTITVDTNTSAAAGRIDNGTIGGAVHLVAINATEWVALNVVGTWTVT